MFALVATVNYLLSLFQDQLTELSLLCLPFINLFHLTETIVSSLCHIGQLSCPIDITPVSARFITY